MNTKTQYQTKQRDDLLAFLKEQSGQHITVNDICSHFKAKGVSIGTATIYRQLDKMVSQGIVVKYVIDVGSPACFEYVGEQAHQTEGSCYHCKCEICGRLVHMHCEELVKLEKHLKGHHGFTVNPMRTVFYGICDSCAAAES